MAFSPIPYDVDAAALDETGSFGLALRSGRLVATVVSKKSGKHITVQLRAKRREGKRFRACDLDVAERIYLDVPGPNGSGSEIGVLHLVGKWSGRILPPWEADFDEARVWAARRILDVAHGRTQASDEKAEILEGKICLACGRELTEPESIARNIGPECWKRVTGLGAAAGEHQAPGEQLSGFTEALASDHARRERPTEAEVIANDKRHADIEKIEVEESKSTEEAEALWAERRARGEIQDPADFAQRVLDFNELSESAEDGANGEFDVPDGASAQEALDAVLPQLRELGDEVRREASKEEIRETIEAELQETIRPPAGEEPIEDLPPPPPVVPEGLVLLRAGDDPRRFLEESTP